MAALPPGRLTRKQIRDLACRKAGNTSLSETDAVSYLQLILDDLYQQHPWPFLNVQAGFAVVSNTFPLPADFLQSQDQSALQLITIDGVPLEQRLLEVDRELFEQARVNTSTGDTEGVPRIWHADRANGLGLIFPDPSGHVIQATLRYRMFPATQIDQNGVALQSEQTDVPVYPYHHHLIQQLYALLLMYEGDSRADDAQGKADTELQRVLGAATPARSVKPVIPLDEEVFTTPFRSD